MGYGWRRGRAGIGVPFGDPFWYDDYYYPVTVNIPLPTPDMIAKALPERALQPAERTEGFLYFDRVDRKARMANFIATLADAASGAPVTTIEIPFIVR
jgi:hypothetical protein